MMHSLTHFPNEILSEIFGLLELRDISSCIRTCKDFQALLEPSFYSELTFLPEAEERWKWVASEKAVEARPVYLFFRSLVSRPTLGRYVRRLQYRGPSRRLQTRTLLNPRKGMPSKAFRGPDKWRVITVRQAMEEALPFFDDREMGLLHQLNAKLSHFTVDDDGGGRAEEAYKQTEWSLPEAMLQQGVTLSMLDLIILFSPGITNISISINAEKEEREPFRLYSPTLAGNASHIDLDQITKFSSLSRFQFAIKNQAHSAKDSALHAQDITNLLGFGNVEEFVVRFVGLQPVSWPGAQRPVLSSLKSLVLAPTFPNVAQLNTWLSAMPALTSLEYHINIDIGIEESRRLYCEEIRRALDQVHNSLERLELYFGTDLTNAPGPVDDEPGAGVMGCIGSLSHFSKLHTLAISLAMLIGQGDASNNTPRLANLLPHTLSRFYLIEDRDGLGYGWNTETTGVLYTEFLTSVGDTHPNLRYFQLLTDAIHHPTLSEKQNRAIMIRKCESQGITFEVASADDWDTNFRFEDGISGFS